MSTVKLTIVNLTVFLRLSNNFWFSEIYLQKVNCRLIVNSTKLELINIVFLRNL